MAKQFKPLRSEKAAQAWASAKVRQMTRQEKISLIGGDRIFFTNAIPRLGIPAVMMADATTGIKLRAEFMEYKYEPVLPYSTSFPCATILASTWNPELSRVYARSIGEECQAAGIAVLLGPGMNIYRISQCGRNFEYFGEDPYLAGAMVGPYVQGLQSTGTIATLKHFVANNSDFFRRRSNSVVDERALREIYTPAFKAGIDAGAMAVMTSYNLVNGEWASQSDFVINQLLRQALGFSWLVMTDWWAIYDGRKAMTSGLDIEMPDSKVALKDAAALIEAEPALETQLDAMVTRLLKTLYAMKSFERKAKPGLLKKFPDHARVALQTAREGTVLLRNQNGILPLAKQGTILLTGDYINTIAAGGGAAAVQGYDQITLEQALKREFPQQIIVAANPTDAEIAGADTVILSIGTFDSEGWDRPYDLSPEKEAAILRVASLNPRVIGVINSGSGINLTRWHDKLAGIIYAWYGGQCGNAAVAEIISGTVNPSGKLPISLERDFKDSPGYGYLPPGESLYSGWNDEAEKTHAVFDVHYNEGIFVGYRWYEKQGIKPLYPFGFGLSYTNYAYSDLRIKVGQEITVSCRIHNQGTVDGMEVAQLYIQDPECSQPRPVKELKAFAKVAVAAGKTATATFKLSRRDFMFWDPKSRDWKMEAGLFHIIVGASSADIRLSGEIEL